VPPVLRDIFEDALLLAAGIVLQVVIAPLIGIGAVTPDFVLIGVCVVGARRGRMEGAIAGFAAGLLMDLSLGEVAGLFALAKTIAGFASGFLFDEEHPGDVLRTARFVSVALVIAFVHNALSLILYLRVINASYAMLLLAHGVGGAIYSTVFTASAVLILSRIAHRIDVQG
jgi:rod shape-determining protein MreD